VQWEQAVKLFEERNPGIDVTTSFQAFGSYWETLATETAGGNPPDVMQMDYRYLDEYAGRNALLDLTPFLDKQIKLADWNPGFAGLRPPRPSPNSVLRGRGGSVSVHGGSLVRCRC
jgi:multiple sugar transport system substrate-binding protein